MLRVPLDLSGEVVSEAGSPHVRFRLRNRSNHIAFFERVAVTAGKDGPEVLPILYTKNDITLFPGEAESISSTIPGKMPADPWLRIEGYNASKELVRISEAGAPAR